LKRLNAGFNRIPVLKIDDPLAEKAVQIGSRIGLITTAATTLGSSRKLIEDWAARLGKKVQVQPLLETEAFQARMSGDIEQHDRIVKDAVLKLTAENEMVVLAQASMAHLAEQLKVTIEVPVLASPELCMQTLRGMAGPEFIIEYRRLKTRYTPNPVISLPRPPRWKALPTMRNPKWSLPRKNYTGS
jgi:Asp/Glu/hydantoin racemase